MSLKKYKLKKFRKDFKEFFTKKIAIYIIDRIYILNNYGFENDKTEFTIQLITGYQLSHEFKKDLPDNIRIKLLSYPSEQRIYYVTSELMREHKSMFFFVFLEDTSVAEKKIIDYFIKEGRVVYFYKNSNTKDYKLYNFNEKFTDG
jgi:hypothetical protein